MAEYIEREAAIESLPVAWDSAINALRNAPSADVAPVVRCKDCKYWQDNNGGYPHEECRWGHGETPDANDFCSYGEQKDGDDDAKEN